MHELSIASGIVDIIEENLPERGDRVTEIEIEIGSLSGVVREALDFAMEVAFKKTCLQDARIIIIDIPAEASCNECGKEFSPVNPYADCPCCGSYRKTLQKGTELRVRSFVVDDKE